MAIVTQFVFAAQADHRMGPNHIRAAGVQLPVHVGIAGPAKLQTMIKFAMACGVLRPLAEGAAEARQWISPSLMLPYEPDRCRASASADHMAANPDSLIKKLHIFPAGAGILGQRRLGSTAIASRV